MMNAPAPWPTVGQPRNRVVDLLRTFAEALSTQYPDLEGRVVVSQREDDPRYLVSFYLLNHKMGGYNTRLLSVEQPIDSSFPVVLTMHYKTFSAPPQTLTEAEFEPALRRELASTPVQNILNNLLALGNTMDDYRRPLNQSA